MKSAKELLAVLRQTDESDKIEAKECTQKIDRSFMETVCSMTNEPDLGGGYIIVGVKSDNSKHLSDRYTVAHVDDPDKIKSEIVTKCATMFNHRINVKIDTQQLDGKTVLVVEVPEGEPELKPYFFKNLGLPKGAYRRGSASDFEGTDDDMQLYYSSKKDFDKGIVEEANLEDIDDVALTRYRELRTKVNPHAEELNYNDRDLLEALGCIKLNKQKEWKLTYTGLLVFGKSSALRRIMPMVRADYIRVPGNEWVEDPEHRFETIDMRSPMILLVNRIYNAIIDDLPRSFSLQDGDIQASNSIKLPEKALREAIVNALIHRSYTVKGNNPSEKGNNPSEKGNNPSEKGNNPSTEQFEWIPDVLMAKIGELGRWSKKDTLFSIVEELCSLRPLTMEEIALIIKRSLGYTRIKIINPLKKEGRLAFTHPEMANHPDQKYKVGLNKSSTFAQ